VRIRTKNVPSVDLPAGRIFRARHKAARKVGSGPPLGAIGVEWTFVTWQERASRPMLKKSAIASSGRPFFHSMPSSSTST
jgi:hypothetical protein